MVQPTGPQESRSALVTLRVLIAGLVVVIIILGFSVVLLTTIKSTAPVEFGHTRVNALANSTNSCVMCHKKTTPGIVEQYGHSTMAAADVTCQDCHEVRSNYPGAVEHEGTYVIPEPTPAMCQKCHQNEVAQFNASRHGAPAYAAMWGTSHFTPEQLATFQAIPEGSFSPDKGRNQIFDMEGPAITRFACQPCHNIGKPHLDGSIGECQSCHIRHEFSFEQVRKPETCNACHIGPDHPQWEIFQESPHGIVYMTSSDKYHWEAEAGTLTVKDFPAPTCATCHFSGFGSSGTTHDVGERLTWYLFGSISERRPSWESNMVRMQGICRECHNNNFVKRFYEDADKLTLQVNEWVKESQEVYKHVLDAGLITPEPFDEPIDYVYFDLWHHWGRTTKFGAWMQGADYVQWHGAYELLRDMAELKKLVNEKLEKAGLPTVEFKRTGPMEDYQ